MGSIVSVIAELETAIGVEAAAPANNDGTGGTTFPVEILVGDEFISKMPGAAGRVVLALGDGEVTGAKRMRDDLKTLATWTPTIEAHVWVPVGDVGARTSLLRYDAIEALIKVVLRAVYRVFEGAQTVNSARPLADSIAMNRETRQLKNGQSAVISFALPIPICRGRTLTTFPVGTRGVLTIVANPPDT